MQTHRYVAEYAFFIDTIALSLACMIELTPELNTFCFITG